MSKTATVKLKTEGVTNLTTELNSASKAADKLEGALEGTADAADEVGDASNQMSGGLDRMSGGMITMFKGAVKGAKTFVMGLRSVKGAMMATGIGALVVIVASLVMYFTKTKKGAEMLEIASAALGVVIGKVTDVFSSLGGIMVGLFTDPVQAIKDFGGFLKTFVMDRVTNLMDGLGFLGSAIAKLFSGDFSGAMDDAVKGVENLAMANPLIAGTVLVVTELVDATKKVVTETYNAVKAQNALTQRSIALRKSIRDTNEAFSDQRKEIADLNKQGDDTSLSIEKRIEATEKAAAKEQALMDQRVANAQEAIDIQIAQMALTESLEEDEIALSELRVALSDVQTESLGVQTGLLTKVNGLYLEQEATAKEIADAELLRIDTLKKATQSAQQNEIDAVAKKYEELNVMAKGNAETEAQLKEKQDAELLAITKKYAVKEEEVVEEVEKTKQELRKETIDKVMAMTNAAFSLFAALDQGREDDDKKTAKKRFQRAKKMQMASVVMSTASAIISALSAPPVGLGFPAGLPGAVTAGLTGAASLVSIGKTRFDGGTTETPSPPDASSSANLTTALVPDTFAPSNTSATSVDSLTDKPIKAFVVAQDMTSQQQMDANLLHHATL